MEGFCCPWLHSDGLHRLCWVDSCSNSAGSQNLQGQALSMQVIRVIYLLACGIRTVSDRRGLALSLCSC